MASLLGVTTVWAASGGLDHTFDADGKQTTDLGTNRSDVAFGMALQSDGKAVLVGHTYDQLNPADASTNNWLVARYNKDGTPDSTFNGDGLVTTDLGGFDDARAVAVQSNGRIVVVGNTCAPTCSIAVVRYTTGGALDSSFNGTGKRILPGGITSSGGLAVQSDGKFVIAGSFKNGSGNYDFAVYRLNGSDGSPDSSFSSDGRMNIGFGTNRNDLAADLILQGGKVVVVGETCGAKCNFSVARLKSDGRLDRTFSGDGKQITDFGADEYGMAVAKQADGKIVLVGEKQTTMTSYVALARYNPDGSLDPAFHGSGKRIIRVGSDSRAWDVLVQGNGKIVVAGQGWGADSNFGIVRLLPDGSSDTTFSSDGKAMVNFGGADEAHALVRQSNGKYILAGSASNGTDPDLALARILP